MFPGLEVFPADNLARFAVDDDVASFFYTAKFGGTTAQKLTAVPFFRK
jgi:hypothetical protein